MKNNNKVSFPRVNPNFIANNLRKGVGRDKAFRIADNLHRELSKIDTNDVNEEFVDIKEVRKNERIWLQVRNIIAKQKN